MGRALIGLAIFLAGVLLLLDELGIVPGAMDRLFMPLMIIGLGLLLLVRNRSRRRAARTPSSPRRARERATVVDATPARTVPRGERLAVPREEALKARLHVRLPAGTLRLQAGDTADEFLVGDIYGGALAYAQLNGPVLFAELQPDPAAPVERGAPEWDLRVNPELALRLDVEVGTGAADLDLRNLPLLELNLTTGTGPVDVRLPLPAETPCTVTADVGIGGVTLNVPPNAPLQLDNGDRPGTLDVDHPRLLGPGDSNVATLDIHLVDGPGRAVIRATGEEGGN